jgi:hypothetical protein
VITHLQEAIILIVAFFFPPQMVVVGGVEKSVIEQEKNRFTRLSAKTSCLLFIFPLFKNQNAFLVLREELY